MKRLKVGDQVLWRGAWGEGKEEKATVTRIEATAQVHEKYGNEVSKVDWDKPFIVDLDNGHWAYSTQLKPIA